ncbi:hypothetical protein ACR6C2_07990 [Streptomyces sp. INA 01156]
MAATQLLIDEYWNLPDTPQSDEIFEGPWTTRVLAYQLAGQFSPMADHPKRKQFLHEYEELPDWGGWVRGNICRALAAEGVTLSTINRRKS